MKQAITQPVKIGTRIFFPEIIFMFQKDLHNRHVYL